MVKNVGFADRLVRVIMAVAIALLGFLYQSWWGLAAIVPLATALMSYCPIYLPFGISSLKKK